MAERSLGHLFITSSCSPFFYKTDLLQFFVKNDPFGGKCYSWFMRQMNVLLNRRILVSTNSNKTNKRAAQQMAYQEDHDIASE